MWKYSMQYIVQLAGKITELLAENHNFVDKVRKQISLYQVLPYI